MNARLVKSIVVEQTARRWYVSGGRDRDACESLRKLTQADPRGIKHKRFTRQTKVDSDRRRHYLLNMLKEPMTTSIREWLDVGGSVRDDARMATEALVDAARNGNVDAVTLLLDEGADINGRTGGGGTALFFALRHPDVVKLLLDRGADSDICTNDGTSVLMHAQLYPETLGILV